MVKKSKFNKILVVFGTRPEAIKMAPIVAELKNTMQVRVCVTAQHREMLDQVLELFEILPEYDLNIMKPGQDLFDVTSNVLLGIKKILYKEQPDLVLVHGDTSTAMTASLGAFYFNIPVGHVEAGLRTHDISTPFPEELNRQIIARIARFHFAPTETAKNNLINEQIPKKNIYVTGNSVIDALLSVIDKAKSVEYTDKLLSKLSFINKESQDLPRIVLVTGHRRENFGFGFEEICQALKEIAIQNPDIQIVFPVHLNPNVTQPVNRILSNIDNIHLIEPLDYLTFVKLLNDSYLILTDSGGIQEEAPSLGKPVIVMRETTERTEAVISGTVRLVGSDKRKIIQAVNDLLTDKLAYDKMSKMDNPYGDGRTSKRILRILNEVSE
jgi:UDP-N-acetylglucosamine 2-epimerase (non-hydrolysing)